MSGPARILIVDDHPLVREGLITRIASEPDLSVCCEAGDVDEGLSKFERDNPDLTIIDLNLVHGHGIDLIRQIRERAPEAKILVITAAEEAVFGERVLKAGASGFINKQSVNADVVKGIRSVLSGRRFISRNLRKRLLDIAIDGESSKRAGIDKLSNRELEILRMIGKGLSSRAIAEELQRSIHTIQTHRENIRNKLELASSTELVRYAIRMELKNP